MLHIKMLQHPLFCCNTSRRLPHKRLDNLYTRRYHQTQLYNKTKINAKITMLNIIKNSFITFYKYLPILIPVGLVSPTYNYFFPTETYPVSNTIISYFCTLIIITALSNIRSFSHFKSWKLWTSYTITFFLLKGILQPKIQDFVFEIIIKKILFSIDYLCNTFSFYSIILLTISYCSFCFAMIYFVTINNKQISTKEIIKISFSPYWKIIILIGIIDVPTYFFSTNIQKPLFIIILNWYLLCMLYCFVANFYKTKEKPV